MRRLAVVTLLSLVALGLCVTTGHAKERYGSDSHVSSGEAERQYHDKPFAPFWEKEQLLQQMSPRDMETNVENDVFLPEFSKERFRRR